MEYYEETLYLKIRFFYGHFQVCDLTKVKNPEKWVAGLGLPLV